MSASKTKTFRIGHDLADAMDLRAKELGYPSGTDLIKALIRYDTLCQSAHGVTTQWAKLSLTEQDELDSRLLARTLAKKGMKSTEAAKVDWRTL